MCNEVWMTLNRDEIVGTPTDLNFKHSEFLAGSWYVLGVLDALPLIISLLIQIQMNLEMVWSV